MKRHSIFGIAILCIIIYIVFNSGQNNLPIEKIDIPSGVSQDIIKNSTGNEYVVSVDMYTFGKKDEISSMILEGIGPNLPDIRATRQLISSKKLMLGLQKIFLLGEDYASAGINPFADILFTNQDMNDSAWMVVCKGKALDMLKYKVDDFPTSSDYINGMIESSREQNFMSNNYKLLDVYVRLGSEGRNLNLPYLQIVNSKISITGIAVFKKDKMVTAIPMDEAKYMNMLRESNVRGMLTLQKDPRHWISSYGEMNRKVKCKKSNGKYKFIIDLDFQGKVVNNTMYKDFMNNPKIIEQYTHELKKDTEKKCNEFVHKMQKEYKTDCLELGRDAAATFGRNTGTDWNKIVCDSEIEVNVKVKLSDFGRGLFER